MPDLSDEEIIETVRRVTANYCRGDDDKVELDWIINEGGKRGLGVDGNDADDLLEAIGKALGWQLKEFEFDRYFGPEGIDLLHLFRFMWGLERWRKHEPLTIAALAERYVRDRPSATCL